MTTLETDIQTVWGSARATLDCARPDQQQVSDLIAAIHDCAERAKAIGFVNGERELRRMAKILEWRICPADYPRYADGIDGRQAA